MMDTADIAMDLAPIFYSQKDPEYMDPEYDRNKTMSPRKLKIDNKHNIFKSTKPTPKMRQTIITNM